MEASDTLLNFFPDKCRLRIVRKPFFVFFDNLQLNGVFNWLNMHLSDSSTMSKVDDCHSIYLHI